MRYGAVAVAAAIVLAAAPAAGAATPTQVRALAARAERDPAALAALRRITVVGGHQVDFRDLLSVSGDALQGRLHALAAPGPATATPPDANARARHILSERRFTGSSVPRPFKGVLGWLGGKLSFIGRFVDRLGRVVPGGVTSVWIILSLLVVGIAAVAATRVAQRREGRLLVLERHQHRRQLEDPAKLERDALEAEERGDFERALRLRFRAGLLRLARADRLPLRDSLTGGQAAGLLHLDDFDALVREFDEVVYGRRTPGREDVARAREEWTRVLARTGAA
jgi:Domain of unknown function (DUF4129)